MKIKNFAIFFLLSWSCIISSCAQDSVPTDRPVIANEKFDSRLQDLLSFSMPLLGVKELAETTDKEYLILDAREYEEFKISHIPGAKYFGYKNPEWGVLDNISKSRPIILYCSVGYRSEKLAEEFKQQGYTNVFNLYGSIFEWANAGYPLSDINEKPTRQIHTYNKRWSQWVQDNGDIEKIW